MVTIKASSRIGVVCLALSAACTSAPPEPVSSPRTQVPPAASSAPAAAPSPSPGPIASSTTVPSAAPASTASAAMEGALDGGVDAAAAAEKIDWKNEQAYALTSPDLTERAKALFE